MYKTLSMKEDFTSLQLTRLVYGETTGAETAMLLELAASVPQIGDTLDALEKGKEVLGDPQYTPSEAVINRLLAYSITTSPVSAG